PRILPEVVSATGSLGSTPRAGRPGRSNAAAATPDWTRKRRRSRRSIVVMASDPPLRPSIYPISANRLVIFNLDSAVGNLGSSHQSDIPRIPGFFDRLLQTIRAFTVAQVLHHR